MPVDQTSPQFLGQLRNLAKGFLAWAGEEGQEGHHPPDPAQHQQGLQQARPDADINEPPSYPKKAAGMLLMSPDGRALFVRRQGDDHQGEWSVPGGMTKGDEQPWQTARREATEEVGQFDCDNMQLLDHNYDGNLGFTTYGDRVNDVFTPVLNHEHDAFQWATPDQAPQPLHPGLKSTLDFATDPLTEKGSKIMSAMQSQYGPEKGKQVFYASRNAGKISGVDNPIAPVSPNSAIPTTGRQDTGILAQRPPMGGHADNPFRANIDNWVKPQWDQRAGGGQRFSQPVQQVARTVDAGWAKPGPDQASTGKTAEIEAAVRREGGVRDPAAVAAATRAKMIGRPALQAKAAAARRGGDNRQSDPLQRFKLYDSQGGIFYDMDKPLPIARSSPSAMGSKIEGQDDWGQTGSDPMTKPALEQQHVTPPAAAAPPMRSMPRRSFGGPPPQGSQMGMNRPMNAGPKYTQTVKMDYGDGTVDERKLTRPGGPPPQSQQWLTPKWGSPGGQQQDNWPTSPSSPQDAGWTAPQWGQPKPKPQDQGGGWPTSQSLGPSAKGGGARF